MQKVLIMLTKQASLRSEVEGWDHVEDPSLYQKGKHVGLTLASTEKWNYSCVLEAMADGWHLLSAPQEHADHTATWWLVKTV